MRSFSLISPRLWSSQRFLGLPSDDHRLLHLYLLTCRHQTSIGAYHLPDAYACADIGWAKEHYLQAREELVKADLIAFDSDVAIVGIKRWFKHNPISNEKHRMGALRLVSELESPSVAGVVMSELEESMRARGAERPAAIESKTVFGSGRPASVAAMEGPYPVIPRRRS